MYTWKVLLTAFIIFLTCLLPLENPVVAQSIEDQSGNHYVKFDLHVVDAFTGKPLDGYIEINAIVADELWKESIEVPGRSLKLVYQGSFKNGKVSFQVPLHGKYDFILHAYGCEDLPPYEPFYGEFIYDSSCRGHLNCLWVVCRNTRSFNPLKKLQPPELINIPRQDR